MDSSIGSQPVSSRHAFSADLAFFPAAPKTALPASERAKMKIATNEIQLEFPNIDTLIAEANPDNGFHKRGRRKLRRSGNSHHSRKHIPEQLEIPFDPPVAGLQTSAQRA